MTAGAARLQFAYVGPDQLAHALAINEIDEFVGMDAAEDSAMGAVGQVDLASVLVIQYLNQNHLDYNDNPFVGPFINPQKE